MIKRNITLITLIIVLFQPVIGQAKKEDSALKREVTLYNPYRPSLPEVKKKSFLPVINDTVKLNPTFRYSVTSKPFSPSYAISPIKAASLLSDPLPKLYKSYLKIGIGNNNTPLGEFSVSNHRSKKGAVGFIARHYSSNGKVPLKNDQKVFAGFMDNDASLYGKKFFRKSTLGLSADFIQKTRYAYGYNTDSFFYEAKKKDIKIGNFDIGAKATYSSVNLDSTEFSYDFGISYDYFHNSKYFTMNHAGLKGSMSKLYEGLYVGSGIEFDHYDLSDSLGIDPKYIFQLSPFIRKSTEIWNFNLGAKLAFDRNLTSSAKIRFYPDVNIGFSIVPEYLNFFAGLSGKLVNNDPLSVISDNPFLVPDGSLFRVPNTSYSLIMSAGVKGNNGIRGNYLVSASYSSVNDMLMYANVAYPDTASHIERGNHFIVLPDDGEVFNLHGEINGAITEKLRFNGDGNYFRYTLSNNMYAWYCPDWTARLGFQYNLRDKIFAGTELTLLGKRRFITNQSPTGWMTLEPTEVLEKPAHFNLSLNAEYRYTKILSFWIKINNISFDRYYELEFYPSQMFNFMMGFSYSL